MPATMMLLWTTLLLACGDRGGPFTGPPRPPSSHFSDPALGEPGTSPALQLWKLPGAFVLPPTTLPEGFTLDSRVPVALRSRGNGRWAGPSPFVDTVRSRVGAPEGLRLFAGDQELDYDRAPSPGRWTVRDDHIVLGWPDGEPPPVTMSWDRARKALMRREPSQTSDPPEVFSRLSVGIDDHTRPGLLLPAPATASFDVTLPSGARFEGWPAIAPPPFTTLRSDGAWISLTVIVDGKETEVDRRFLHPDRPFAEWAADLSPWGGQAVTLRIATETHHTRDFDHVFIGAPTVWGAAPGEVRRVVVIGLDTTRPDHFGFFGYDRPTTPEIDAWLGTSTVFDHAWCPAPRTRPSFRSATTGRNPLDAVGATNIGQVFSDAGFATAGIVSNVHLQPRFDFDEGFDLWRFDARATAKEQVDRALAFLDRYPQRDAYLFLHIMDPHLLYTPPRHLAREFVRDPDPELPETFNRWEVYRWMNTGELTEQRQQHIMDLYDAELRGMSIQLGRFFDQLDRMPGRSLVVLHNDHGEEFWEHGAFEHNHALYDEVTRGLLAFRANGGQSEGRRLSVPATLADIGPTLYDFAGIDDPPPTDGRSLAGLLRSTEPPPASWSDRVLGVAHLRYGKQRWAVVANQHKYILHTASGQEELFDLRADPGEQNDLTRSSTPDLEPYRAALAKAHQMPVGPGWRVAVDVASKDRRPFVLELPAPAVSAGVIDPEATVESPANQAWGELPKKGPADIGAISLSDDKRVLTFEPAPATRGVVRGLLYVLFDAPTGAEGVVLRRGGETEPLELNLPGAWQYGPDGVQVRPGTVLVPPRSEADRIRQLRGQTEDAGDDHDMLQKLGYIEEDSH